MQRPCNYNIVVNFFFFALPEAQKEISILTVLLSFVTSHTRTTPSLQPLGSPRSSALELGILQGRIKGLFPPALLPAAPESHERVLQHRQVNSDLSQHPPVSVLYSLLEAVRGLFLCLPALWKKTTLTKPLGKAEAANSSWHTGLHLLNTLS